MAVWEEIVDYTVPSNTTSVTLNNFGTITKDDFIKIVVTLKSSVADTNFIHFLPTGESTNNFYNQLLLGRSSSVIAERLNNPVTFTATANDFSTTFAYLKLSENDKFNVFLNNNGENGSDIDVAFRYATSTSSYANGITSLTFIEGISGRPIGANSRIQIYKLTAEKVADITVASNTTQVDITGLNIDKGSEYLLVSDIVNPTSLSAYGVYYNNNTSNSNYYYQRIRGSGTAANALRENASSFTSNATNQRSLTYKHIKLSNTGTFTVQGYSIPNYGTSSMHLQNLFTSSTAENITNITELNILRWYTSNASIGNGSRFELYKLY